MIQALRDDWFSVDKEEGKNGESGSTEDTDI